MDKIFNMKYLRKKNYNLIQWLGYENQPTWEPASNVLNDAASKKNISDFMAAHQPPHEKVEQQDRGVKLIYEQRELADRLCRSILTLTLIRIL